MEPPTEELRRCQWCYRHRISLTAVGAGLALAMLFVGVIMMASVSEQTTGWALLIFSACVLLGVLCFLAVLAAIKALCPNYVVEPPDITAQTDIESESEASKIAASAGRHTKSVFVVDGQHNGEDQDDEFDL